MSEETTDNTNNITSSDKSHYHQNPNGSPKGWLSNSEKGGRASKGGKGEGTPISEENDENRKRDMTIENYCPSNRNTEPKGVVKNEDRLACKIPATADNVGPILGPCDNRGPGTREGAATAEKGRGSKEEPKELPNKRTLLSAPTGLMATRVSSVSASLSWDSNNDLTEHTIRIQERKEGREWGGEEDDDDEGEENISVRVDNINMRCFACPLKPNTTYEFRVKGRNKGGAETRWSDPVYVKTKGGTIPEIYKATRELRENANNADKCAELLAGISTLLGNRGCK